MPPDPLQPRMLLIAAASRIPRGVF